MMKPSVMFLAIGLAIASDGASVKVETDNNPPASPSRVPSLVNTCLITDNVRELVEFYEPILLSKANRSGEDYAEFRTGVEVLAIFSAKAQDRYIPGASQAAKNKSVILEFRVGDVDREYGRLRHLVKTWVKSPTTQPWGTRSAYFRDPDGNLIDFYAPIKAQ